MIEVIDRAETDVQKRILLTAERLFREIGYQKTTVADIAKDLQMSSANVYRFFDSKKSINAGVARRLMKEVEDASEAVAGRSGDPVERLRELLVTINRMNTDRYVGDSKMHTMIASAMEENWDVCQEHMMSITQSMSQVIADGIKAGKFKTGDVQLAASCVLMSMVRFFHPQLIAECANKPGPSLDEMIDFVISGLLRKN